MTVAAGVLLLADGRSPSGGLAHSGGVEAAIEAGIVSDEETLLALLEVRLATAGLVAAGLAAAACLAAGGADFAAGLTQLDIEADARMPSEAARIASRAQGRGLLRLARAGWPHQAYSPGGPLGERPHHPLVLGVAVCAAGGSSSDAALVAALASVSGPASAAVRLLGLDPIAVTGLLARLGPAAENTARVAQQAVSLNELPSAGHPLFDVFAEQHAGRPSTLFTS
jgi:urease accessory protein